MSLLTDFKCAGMTDFLARCFMKKKRVKHTKQDTTNMFESKDKMRNVKTHFCISHNSNKLKIYD